MRFGLIYRISSYWVIGEILFDLQDKQLLRIILLPLLVRFDLIYRMNYPTSLIGDIWFDLQDK